MRTILLILLISLFIPQSFAEDNKTIVASINTQDRTEQKKNKNRNYFNLNSYDVFNLNLMYDNTYDFIKSQYSYYKELELFASDLPDFGSLKDSVTFVGGVLPFFSLAENDGREGSSFTDEGMSVFFYYKKQF